MNVSELNYEELRTLQDKIEPVWFFLSLLYTEDDAFFRELTDFLVDVYYYLPRKKELSKTERLKDALARE